MKRLFVLVAAVILVDTMFYAAIAPLLPTYADDLGLSKTAAGVLSASYAAGTLLASIPAGFAAAKLGVRPTMLAGLTLLAGSSVTFAFADDVLILDLARFTQGVGGACAWTSGLTWLMVTAPRERRGEVIGAVLAVAIAGIMLGPALGGVATVVGPEPVFALVGVLALAIATRAAVMPAITPEEPPPARAVAAAVASAPVLLAFWLVALPSMLAGAVDVLLPLRLDDLGASGVAVGAVFLVAAAVEAGLSPRIGAFSDRRGRFVPIRAGLIAAAVLVVSLAIPDAIVPLGLLFVVTVLAMSFLWTPAMALLSDRSEAAGLDLAFAAALVNLAWAGGQVLGGSAGPGLAEQTSDAVTYGVIAGLFLLTALVIRRRRDAATLETPATAAQTS